MTPRYAANIAGIELILNLRNEKFIHNIFIVIPNIGMFFKNPGVPC